LGCVGLFSSKRSVFREDGFEKLSFEYVPSRLPHREDYVKRLTNFLRLVIDQPGAISERVLITGNSGTGKTATAKLVGSTLERIAKNKGIELVYAHVNCRATSGKFGLVQSIVRQVAPELPTRGYGATEMLYSLWDYLEGENKILILTLDEIDYYVRTTGEDIVYELTRLTNSVRDVPQRLNFIFIARDHSFMEVLSPSTLSKFRPQEHFEFPPYLENQLKDILMDRVEEAFRKNTVSGEIVEFISRNAAKYGNGDARYAIQLLTAAGYIADRDLSDRVKPEHVREAQSRTDPRLSDEDVAMLSEEEKYVLLALTRVLMWGEEIYVPFEEVESHYRAICEEYGREPVGKAMFQGIVQTLKAAGVVVVSENLELGLDGVRAEVLEKFLTRLLERIEEEHDA
jgi:cell division control protein 6